MAGTDAPLGVNAFAPRHRQIVLFPTVVIVAHQLEIIFQRDGRLWVLRNQVRTRLAPPLVEAWNDAVAHHEIHAIRRRLHGFSHGLEAVGFRHLDAADEIRSHIAFAEYGYLINQASHPAVPTDAAVFPRIDPFKQALVP